MVDNLLCVNEQDYVEAVREMYASGSDSKHLWTFDNMGTEEVSCAHAFSASLPAHAPAHAQGTCCRVLQR